MSSALLAMSLLFDLFQYCFRFYKWSSFHRNQELKAFAADGKIVEDEIEVLAPTTIKKTLILYSGSRFF